MSKVELYEAKIITIYTFECEKTVHVMGGSIADAQREARALKLDNHFTYTDMMGIPVTSKSGAVVVKKLKAIKGTKRPQLSPTQTKLIKVLLTDFPNGVLKFCTSDNTWECSGNNKLARIPIEKRTIKALVTKNLLVPVPMTSKERKAQQALGVMEIGHISLMLNLEQIRKRKSFQGII